MQPDPTLLAFDTSAAHCAAALRLNGMVHVVVEEMARGQGERLMPLLEGLLAKHDQTWADLDAIAVGIGPGNFTGIRISVSAARGLALALEVPAVGMSLFETTQHLANCAMTTVPAPRDQVYLFDAETMQTPVMTDTPPAMARSSAAFAASAHMEAMAHIAAARIMQGGDIPAPAPLYVKAPDAAPSREHPPLILP
ncbi:tRNA (adenosine(37)-N6)-threonylcarbamoyltransferase complex dimerization subunit type 1 TsaB [Pseudooctadecabacter jejudonensis]|uniref:tRNA threonylcarbamoyladenosine biosynthesis protein TsaB n=1 Tax=Pseudooctadecabacter jejudonensis TaxID=1391910 RepID=A0A1Y5RUT9_9RHOB|nr:tRNA (adenosine(37)-N6)-threonylcarbamoyltransferase complex dimerization subunit type 1 TsaB [Pseudooctadecabacter jejudonensis]SLN26014.1 tRNA threonylcarbamoyladenosine biosynthesis protein TsaB [Pseudooctadecabacter jejudonensis]